MLPALLRENATFRRFFVGAVAGILWLVPSPIWSLRGLPPVEEAAA